MVSLQDIKRGEVWLIKLDPTIGSEIKKTRPCLIVSPDTLLDKLPTAIIVPMTSGGYEARFRVPVRFEGKSGLILCDQVRMVDRQRLVKRLGKIDSQILTATLNVLNELFEE